jgi:hypothetical protein
LKIFSDFQDCKEQKLYICYARSLHHASVFFSWWTFTGISLILTDASMWNFIQCFENYQLLTLSEKVTYKTLGKLFFNVLRKGDRSLHHAANSWYNLHLLVRFSPVWGSSFLTNHSLFCLLPNCICCEPVKLFLLINMTFVTFWG